jgi:hypothetical protein
MIKTTVNLTKKECQVIDAVKTEFGLKDNNQALSVILKWYEEHELEPQLRSEFIAEIEKTRKSSKFVKIRDFSLEFGDE